MRIPIPNRIAIVCLLAAGVFALTFAQETFGIPERYSEDFTTASFGDPDHTDALWDTQWGRLSLRFAAEIDRWDKLIDGFGAAGISRDGLAVSPFYELDQTLYAMTGAHGIFRSQDGGSSWSRFREDIFNTSPISLRFSPNYTLDRTIFVATSIGIYRSTDRGQSWIANHDGIDPIYLDEARATSWALAVSPTFLQDRTVVLATSAAGADRLYLSTDGGDSWVEKTIATEQVDGAVKTHGNFRVIAISPIYFSDRTIFVVSDDGLVRSADGGSTWSAVAACPDGTPNYIAYEPVLADPPALWLSCFSFPKGFLYRSADGGANWEEVSLTGSPDEKPYIYGLSFSPHFSANGLMMAATYSGGVFLSRDGGDSWNRLLNLSPELLTSSPVFAPAAENPPIWVGTFRRGVWYSSDGGATWGEKNDGLGRQGLYALAISPNFARDGTMYVGGSGTGLHISADGGASWQPSPGFPESGATIGSIFFSPAFSTDRTIFVLVSEKGIYRSADGGASWLEVFSDDGVSALALHPQFPVVPDVWIATRGGRIYHSVDGGGIWSEREPVSACDICSVNIHPGFDREGKFEVWAAAMRTGVFVSKDKGASWTRKTAFPRPYPNRIAKSPNYREDGIMLIGEYGIYYSHDGGDSWSAGTSPGDSGFATAYSGNIVFSPDFANDQTVFAATGNGIYISRNGGVTWERDRAYMKSVPHALARDIAVALAPDGNYQFFVIGGPSVYSARLPVISPAQAQSLNVNVSGAPVVKARLALDMELNGGAVDCFLSNDGGSSWHSVTPDVEFEFPEAGADLRWKIEIHSGSFVQTPLVEGLSIEFGDATLPPPSLPLPKPPDGPGPPAPSPTPPNHQVSGGCSLLPTR